MMPVKMYLTKTVSANTRLGDERNCKLPQSCDLSCDFPQTYWHISLMRWVLVGIIGILTGFTAFLINFGIFYLREFKNETFFIGEEA